MPTRDSTTKRILANPKKRQAWVIYNLKLRGLSLAALARRAGVKKQCMQAAMSRPYPRMEKFIADALGLPPQQLFPERYDEDGLPNRSRGRRPHKISCPDSKHTTRRTAGNGGVRNAA